MRIGTGGRPRRFRGGFGDLRRRLAHSQAIRTPVSTQARLYPLLWLSFWLSFRQNLAGMDGNRTHPGRLSSAPQTVLKTAGVPSITVPSSPLPFSRKYRLSTILRCRTPTSADLAVILAVMKLLDGPPARRARRARPREIQIFEDCAHARSTRTSRPSTRRLS